MRKAVVENTLVIDRDPNLDALAATCIMRSIGRALGEDVTPWRLSKRDPEGPAITPIISIALALERLESTHPLAGIPQLM
jgi:hypothetical protein